MTINSVQCGRRLQFPLPSFAAAYRHGWGAVTGTASLARHPVAMKGFNQSKFKGPPKCNNGAAHLKRHSRIPSIVEGAQANFFTNNVGVVEHIEAVNARRMSWILALVEMYFKRYLSIGVWTLHSEETRKYKSAETR